MRRISLIISFVALCIVSRTSWAQQDAMFTQYMFNGLALNPAYAGSHDAISTSLLYRNQWVDVDGAPNTGAFTIHSPLGNDKLAVGLQVVRDQIGISKETVFNASLAYRVPITEKAKLSFGLSIGGNRLDYNFNDLELGGTNDVFFDPSNNINESRANVGAGVFYYSSKTFLGVSIPRLIENEFGSGEGVYTQRRLFYVHGGHVFDLHPNLKFKPNILLKATANAPLEMDINANFLFVDKVWAGVSWRSLESVDLIARLLVTEQLSLGYSYDIITNDLRDQTKGSHEFMLNYLFSFQKKKMLSPRYF